MTRRKNKDEEKPKLRLSAKRLVDLYDDYSLTPGKQLEGLRRKIEEACTYLGDDEPKRHKLPAGTVSAWRDKLESDPAYTIKKPEIFAKACLLAFGVDLTHDGIFHKAPLCFGELVKVGSVYLRSQSNSVSDEGVRSFDVVVSHLSMPVRRFPVIAPSETLMQGKYWATSMSHRNALH